MTYKVYDANGCLVSDDLTSLKAIREDLKSAKVDKADIFEAIRCDGQYTTFKGYVQQDRLRDY